MNPNYIEYSKNKIGNLLLALNQVLILKKKY